MIRNLAKKLVLLWFYTLTFAFRKKRSTTLLIVTYHRISQAPDSTDPLKVSVASLESQLRYLSEHFRIISAQELRDIVAGRRTLAENACLITFDDGWADNFTNGLPILVKHKVPALVFLSTDFIGTGRVFWTVALRSLLNEAAPGPSLDEALSHWPPNVAAKVRTAYGLQKSLRGAVIIEIIEDLKPYSVSEIDGFISCLRGLYLNSPIENDGAMLTWEQVLDMQKCGVAFGSHSRSHAILTMLDEDEGRDEILGSRQILESRLGHPVDLIAYPNGDFNDQVIRWAREADYIAGLTCLPGLNKSFERPLELKRLNMREDSGAGLNGSFSPLFFSVELAGTRFVLNGADARDWR